MKPQWRFQVAQKLDGPEALMYDYSLLRSGAKKNFRSNLCAWTLAECHLKEKVDIASILPGLFKWFNQMPHTLALKCWNSIGRHPLCLQQQMQTLDEIDVLMVLPVPIAEFVQEWKVAMLWSRQSTWHGFSWCAPGYDIVPVFKCLFEFLPFPTLRAFEPSAQGAFKYNFFDKSGLADFDECLANVGKSLTMPLNYELIQELVDLCARMQEHLGSQKVSFTDIYRIRRKKWSGHVLLAAYSIAMNQRSLKRKRVLNSIQGALMLFLPRTVVNESVPAIRSESSQSFVPGTITMQRTRLRVDCAWMLHRRRKMAGFLCRTGRIWSSSCLRQFASRRQRLPDIKPAHRSKEVHTRASPRHHCQR